MDRRSVGPSDRDRPAGKTEMSLHPLLFLLVCQAAGGGIS